MMHMRNNRLASLPAIIGLALMIFFGICCWPIYTVLSNAARWWRKH